MFCKKLLSVCLILIPGYLMAQTNDSDTMELKDHSLNEIIVQSVREYSGSREKKQSKDLLKSTDQILSETGGLQMIKRGNFAWEPAVRGMNAGQINVTIDGMQIFGACTDKMDPASSYIEPNNLQSMIINYGTGDQSAGSSIGGGINFKIKQPQIDGSDRWKGLAAMGYESNGIALQTLGSVDYSAKKFAFQANGIFRNSASYWAGKREEVLNSKYQKWNASVGIKYRPAEHHAVAFNYVQDEGRNIGYPGLPMDVLYARAKIASVAHTYFGHHSRLDQIETKLFFNFVNHAMDDSRRISEGDMKMDMPGLSRTSGFYSEGKWKFKNHQFKARINGYQNRLHADMTMHTAYGESMYMLTLPDAERRMFGIDLSSKVRLSNRISVQLGAKADHIQSSLYSTAGKEIVEAVTTDNGPVEKWLYNIYGNFNAKINQNLLLFAGLARSMRAPSLQENYGLYLFNRLDGFDYIGNPALQNESAFNLNLGLSYRKEKLKLSAEGFSYVISHYIAGVQNTKIDEMTPGAEGVKQYQNLRSATLLGIELNAEIPVVRNVSLHSNGKYTYGTDDENRALPLIAPLKLTNRMIYNANNFSFELSSVYSAAQKHVNTAFYGETASKSFAIFNLKAGKSFAFHKQMFSAFLGIDNLLDKNYYEHLSFMHTPSLGRNFTVHLSCAF